MRYHRKVIRIRAEDSPNVRLFLRQKRLGEVPTREVICPGVLTADEYVARRKTWDPVRQCVGLDGLFYKGSELLLFPPHWLDAAEAEARKLSGRKRVALAIGIDPAEGGDKTSMAAVDELGLIALVSRRTPDTNVIVREALDFMRAHGVKPNRVAFDRGGGGKQHADRLRAMGHDVRTVAFGEAFTAEPKYGPTTVPERKEQKEERTSYVNRRAQMYGELSEAMDPGRDGAVFAIPEGCTGDPEDRRSELRHQLAPIPKLYDNRERVYMLPKSNPRDDKDPRTLVALIGHSPDEADAVVLAYHAMTHADSRAVAGAVT